jgi:hypothetical protein
LIGGTSGATNLNNNRYMGMFAGNLSATEVQVQNVVPTNGTVGNFFAFVETAPGGANSWVFTVRKNGVNTAVTCTLSGTAQQCGDTTHTIAFNQGDLISVLVTTATSPATSHGQWTATFGP